jgi:hypothetical protein
VHSLFKVVLARGIKGKGQKVELLESLQTQKGPFLTYFCPGGARDPSGPLVTPHSTEGPLSEKKEASTVLAGAAPQLTPKARLKAKTFKTRFRLVSGEARDKLAILEFFPRSSDDERRFASSLTRTFTTGEFADALNALIRANDQFLKRDGLAGCESYEPQSFANLPRNLKPVTEQLVALWKSNHLVVNENPNSHCKSFSLDSGESRDRKSGGILDGLVDKKYVSTLASSNPKLKWLQDWEKSYLD